MASVGNSMSTTGPMTRATRPVPGAPVGWAAASVVVAVMVSPVVAAGRWSCAWASGGRGQRVGAGDDLADLLGDLGLARLVRQPGVVADEVFRVLGRRVHRTLAGCELGGGGLQEHRVDPARDVPREEGVQDDLRGGLEVVERQRLVRVVRIGNALDDLE